MRKLNTAHLFASPSLASGLLAVMGSVFFLLAANSSILQSDGFLTDLLLGPGSSYGLIQTAEQTTFQLSEITLGNPTLNKILFFLFWMMVGLFVYIIISTLGSTLKGITDTVGEVQRVKARKAHIDQSFWLRLALRLSGGIALVFMYLLSAKLIVPFSTLASRAWIGSLDTISGWLYGILGFAVLALTAHIFVVLVRLVSIKPRLFGGWDVFI